MPAPTHLQSFSQFFVRHVQRALRLLNARVSEHQLDDADERVAYVSRDDLAAAAAGVLVGDGHAGAIYNGTGPAIVSGPEKAAIVSEILGKPLSYAVITEDQLRGGLSHAGLPPFVIDAVAEIKRTFVQGYFDVLTSDIERLSGRAPKSFRDVVGAALSKGSTQ